MFFPHEVQGKAHRPFYMDGSSVLEPIGTPGIVAWLFVFMVAALLAFALIQGVKIHHFLFGDSIPPAKERLH